MDVENSEANGKNTENGVTSPPKDPVCKIVLDHKEGQVSVTDTPCNHKIRFYTEVLGLVTVCMLILALLSLPIIFYYIPDPVQEHRPNLDFQTVSDDNQTCFSYTGKLCLKELNSLRKVLPDHSDHDRGILVQSNPLSENDEFVLMSLNLAHKSCRQNATFLLCAYYFNNYLCDSQGNVYNIIPSESQCRETHNQCMQELSLAGELGLNIDLPDCADFPADDLVPELLDNLTAARLNQSAESQEDNGTMSCDSHAIPCRDNFYCKVFEGTSVCSPVCGKWSMHSQTNATLLDALTLLSAGIGMLSAIALIMMAIWRRKSVFVFPFSFVVYQTMTVLLFDIFIVITYFDRVGLYCTSEDLFESLRVTSPFCIIAGIVLYYTAIQVSIWWLFYIIALFWAIYFPFHSRRVCQNQHQVRYIHLTAISVGLLVPLLPPVITMIDSAVGKKHNRTALPSALGNSTPNTDDNILVGGLGFSMSTFPPILCTGTNEDIAFYTVILPYNINLMIGITLLILIFWAIHKHHGIFKGKSLKDSLKITTAEKKILIASCYYVIFTITSLVTFTLWIKSKDLLVKELTNYFICEQQNPITPCSRKGFEEISYPYVSSLSSFFTCTYPLVLFLFVVKFRDVKEKIQYWYRSLFSRTVTSFSSSASNLH